MSAELPAAEHAGSTSVEIAKAYPSTGKLPLLVAETRADRWAWGILAALIVVGFAYLIHIYWAPAHPGVDQNGYLVGGKLFARTGSNGFKPENPYAFVGRMWVEAADGRMFPKYPLGLSAIYAAMFKSGGAKLGVWLAFTVSPTLMTLAMLGTFMLVRTIAGSFAGVLAVLIVGTSPVTLGLANNPNSHATAICLVTWGMFLAVRWWQSNGLWRAVLAGLLIGLSVTIRYSEGMVALPLGLIALMNLRPRFRQSWIQSMSMLAAWALPVGALAIYNWLSFHHLTGYDPTNESTGFTWDSFKVNWETMLREMYDMGLFFVLPFSLMGLVLMWRWNAKLTLVLTAWVVPNLALYTAYYWAPDNASIGYLRFFLTIFPPLALSAVWSIRWFIDLAATQGVRWTPVIAVGLVLALACGFDLFNALAITENDARTNVGLAAGAEQVLTVCPAGSTIFASDALLNFLQFDGDYHLYETQQFSRQTIQRLSNIDPNVPSLLQAQRAKEMYDRLKDASDSDLVAEQNKLMTNALTQHERVFLIMPAAQIAQVYHFLPRRTFTSSVLATWSEPPDTRSLLRRPRGGGPFNGAPGPGFGGPGGGGFGGGGRAAIAGFLSRRTGEPALGDVTWNIIEVKPAPPYVAPTRTHSTPAKRSSTRNPTTAPIKRATTRPT